jgi:hypothetical protein
MRLSHNKSWRGGINCDHNHSLPPLTATHTGEEGDMSTRAMGLDRGASRADPGGLAGAEAQGGEGARHRRPSSR